MDGPFGSTLAMGIAVYNAQNVILADLSVGEVYWHAIDLEALEGAQQVHMYHCHFFNAGEQIIKSNPTSNSGVDNCTLEYCLVEYTNGPSVIDHGGGTGYTAALHAHEAHNWVISNNLFRNFHTSDSTVTWYSPTILMWNHSAGTIVEGNTFIDCDRAVAFGLQQVTDGYDHQGGVIRNNFVYQHPGLFSDARRAGSDGQLLVYDSPGTQVYHNTVLTNNNSRYSIEVRWANTGVAFDNNLADAPLNARDGGVYSAIGNYLSATPAFFVNPSNADLHLVDGPATRAYVIDQAPVRAGATSDWDGDPRPSGSAPDVGADELLQGSNTPAVQVADDSGTAFSTAGSWPTYAGGYNGSFHFSPVGGPASTATWTFSAGPGLYRVSTSWQPAYNRATAAPFSILDGSTQLGSVLINQQQAPASFTDSSGVAWQDLGNFILSGSQLNVVLGNAGTGPGTYVLADAIRIERLAGAPTVQVSAGSAILTNGSSVAFGSTFTGTPVSRTFTVQNNGSQTLTLGSIIVPTGFGLVSGFGSTNVAPGASTIFAVQLTAISPGGYAGVLSFTNSDGSANPFTVQLSGTVNALPTVQIADDGGAAFSTTGNWSTYAGGYLGSFHFSPVGGPASTATWAFSASPGLYRVSATWQPAYNRATAAPFTVLDGSTQLGSDQINQQPAPASFTDSSGVAWQDLGNFVLSGSQLNVVLGNAGTGPGTYVLADAIRIERLASVPTVLVSAGPAILTNGSSVAFGSAFTGTPVARTFTVTNNGGQALTLGNINVASGFTLSSGFGSTNLAPGTSTTFAVQLTAATPGSYSGTLSFTSSDSSANPFTLQLSGTVNALPTVQIADDTSAAFSTVGSWSTYAGGYGGSFHFSAGGGGENTANWAFSASAGQYRVSITWQPAYNRATDALFSVLDGNTVLTTVQVNQRQPTWSFTDQQGVTWLDLGIFNVGSGPLTVRLSNQGADAFVLADAVRVERLN
jgi:hypothetical protein